MFCPSCGSEENHKNQFCRSCGTNLNPIKMALKTPDTITSSAVSARDEIGRAVAAKIQQTSSSSELSKFAEDVLPEIEKFLESPEERKLRRVRVGSTVSLIGLGVGIGFSIASVFIDRDLVLPAVLGLVTLFIGVSILINGYYFTVPEGKSLPKISEADSNELNSATNELLMPPNAQAGFSSVTENTTRHLKDKKPVSNS